MKERKKRERERERERERRKETPAAAGESEGRRNRHLDTSEGGSGWCRMARRVKFMFHYKSPFFWFHLLSKTHNLK